MNQNVRISLYIVIPIIFWMLSGIFVEEKKPVLKVFADTEDSFKQIKDQIINSFVLTDQEVKKPKNIYQVIN